MASLPNALTSPATMPPWSSQSVQAPKRRRARLSLAGVPHRIFQALDGRQLTASKRTWRMEIYSIVDDGETRWIQLGLRGLERYELTLSAPCNSDAKQIAHGLKTWLGHPLAPVSVLNVA